MKKLVLIRHAKSSWEDPDLDDSERPLNKRGKKDVPIMAGRLRALEMFPDLFLSSPAVRALTTARAIAEGIDYPQESIVENEEIYLADVPELLSVVGAIDDGNDLVFLVGHNPGLTDLANHLGDTPVDNIPTCGICSLEFDVPSWKEVPAGHGTLVVFDYPKKE